MMRQVAAPQPRREQWRGYDQVTRDNLVADALDENDRDHNVMFKAQQTTNKLLTGVLVSTTLAALALAANIALGSL